MKKDYRVKLSGWTVMMGLALAVVVLGVSADRTKQVRAQVVETVTEADEADELVIAPQIKGEEGVDYYLPYPGILPDHPLYWLKMIRDRVQLWLTTQPLAKAEKLLLYADKRLGAGWALIEGNKQELGVTTLSKGEKYLTRAIAEAGKLGEGGDETRFKERLGKGIRKHQEVLGLLKEKMGEEYEGMMGQLLLLNQAEEGNKEVEGEVATESGEIDN
jgi:hypothetical protein